MKGGIGLKKYENIFSCEAKFVSIFDFSNEIKDNDFLVDQIPIKIGAIELNIIHLHKFIKSRGTFIEHFIALEWPSTIMDITELDKIIEGILLSSEKKHNIHVVRQRYVILCLFGKCFHESVIKTLISNANFTFSLLLPVVIDTENAKIYHVEIPTNRFSAKGRAIKDMQEKIIKFLYKT